MNNDPNYTYVYVMQHLQDIQLKRRFFYSFSVGYIKTQNGYLITAAVLTGPAKEDASFVAIFNDYDTKEEIKKKIKELRTWIRKNG